MPGSLAGLVGGSHAAARLAYLQGLLSQVDRKNGWHLAGHAGELTPDGMQRLLNQAGWDVDAVRDELRSYVAERLGDPRAVLVVDETGFGKKGAKSVGVARQRPGRCAEAGVPDQVAFRTKPQLAQALLERAVTAGVPAGWVTGDTVYEGDRRLRIWLEERAVADVRAVGAPSRCGPGPTAARARFPPSGCSRSCRPSSGCASVPDRVPRANASLTGPG